MACCWQALDRGLVAIAHCALDVDNTAVREGFLSAIVSAGGHCVCPASLRIEATVKT